VAAWIGLAGVLGCSPAGDPATPAPSAEELGTLIFEEVSEDLLDLSQQVQVLRQRPEEPPHAGTLRPCAKNRVDGGPMPTWIMPPDCKVVIRLPETEPGAVLRLASGIDESEYVDGRAGVRFVVDLDGERVYERWRRPDPASADAERAWDRIEVPLEGRRWLVLTTKSPAGGDAPTAVGFGGLQIVRRTEVPRRAASAAEPSVLLVCIDTLRADRLGCYGYERPTSPAIDALAARGVRFERAFATSSWTWPSTASLLTGLTPPEHGVVDVTSSYLAQALPTVAEAFRAAGVATGAFSTNPLVSAGRGFGQGFGSFEERPWHTTRSLADDVGAWLDERAGQRFFLYLHLTEPHGPYEPELDFVERFVDFVERFVDYDGPRPTLEQLRSFAERRLAGTASEAELAYQRACSDLYDGEVGTVDRWLGHVLDGLAERGLGESTIVCVTSDHGEEFLEHDLTGHGNQLYDESVRVPLVFAGPGVPAGVVVTERAENRFVPSTLLSLAGVASHGLRGTDLLDRPDRLAAARAPLYLSAERGLWPTGTEILEAPSLSAVDVDGFRLMWAPPTSDRPTDLVRLFELEGDPRMHRDVAAAHPERVYALQRMISSWIDVAEETRPARLDGGAATAELLRGLGYLDGD